MLDEIDLPPNQESCLIPSWFSNYYVRNLFEKMPENQTNRLVYEKELTKENLTMLKEIDLQVNV